MHSARRFAMALVTGSALAGRSAAQSLPAPVGSGPLLCLTTNSLPARDRQVTLHVAELDGDGPARPIWRNQDNANVLARLGRQHLLLASYGTPYALLVLDLAEGKHHVLAAGAPHGFVAVHGDAVLHLGDPRDAARDNFLYLTPWREPSARRRLCDQRFARIGQVAGNLAIAITPDDAAVWIVSLAAATGRTIWTAPAEATSVRVAVSPGGQRLAIGCASSNGKGLLTVVDIGAGTVVRSWPDLPIHVSVLSSSMPTLEVGWHDDAHVVCSQTRGDARGLAGNFVHARYDLASGEIVDEQVYSQLELSHRAPPVPGAAPKPPAAFFSDVEGDSTRLWRAGGKQPLATFARKTEQFGDWRIAPDGQSVVVHQGARSRVETPPATALRCTLLLAAKPGERALLEGGAYDLVWLPAATDAGAPK